MKTVPVLSTSSNDFARRFATIRERGLETAAAVDDQARAIVDAVRRQGDRALLAFGKRFDGVSLRARDLRVTDTAIDAAMSAVAPATRRALKLAARRIAAYHRRQKQISWRFRDDIGVTLGQAVTPLRRVGVYVPGGQAAYPSSVLMNIVPARVAGVGEIVMVTPPHGDGGNPAVFAAARIAGVSSVYQIGGAQAVAALAFGTETVPRVDKIVGPGNAWVQAAKKLVYGVADIDKIAGPSEVLVIADATAPPAYVAADLLAQAEHGSGDECAVLLTTSRRLVEAVAREIDVQLARLPRRAAIEKVLRRRSALVLVRSMDEAVEIAEQVGPEHLEIIAARPEKLAARLRNSGALFLGPFSPAPLGDYLAGTNHVLPTGGTARFFSPLGVYDFMKRTSIVSASRAALQHLAPSIVQLATVEGYAAHANAVRMRFAGANRTSAGRTDARQTSKRTRNGDARRRRTRKGGR